MENSQQQIIFYDSLVQQEIPDGGYKKRRELFETSNAVSDQTSD